MLNHEKRPEGFGMRMANIFPSFGGNSYALFMQCTITKIGDDVFGLWRTMGRCWSLGLAGFRAKGKGRECANGCFVNCTCLVATSNDKVVSMLVDGS